MVDSVFELIEPIDGGGGARCDNRTIQALAYDLGALYVGETTVPMALLRQLLTKLGLSLNETKTRVGDARKESFDFLGLSFHLRRSQRSGKRYPHVEPSRRSVQRIKDRTKALTVRRRTPVPMGQLVVELNRSLRGWSNYFHHHEPHSNARPDAQ